MTVPFCAGDRGETRVSPRGFVEGRPRWTWSRESAGMGVLWGSLASWGGCSGQGGPRVGAAQHSAESSWGQATGALGAG